MQDNGGHCHEYCNVNNFAMLRAQQQQLLEVKQIAQEPEIAVLEQSVNIGHSSELEQVRDGAQGNTQLGAQPNLLDPHNKEDSHNSTDTMRQANSHILD